MGSLRGSGCKTALRVVCCHLECRQSGLICLTPSCCVSARGQFFSGQCRRPSDRGCCGQPPLWDRRDGIIRHSSSPWASPLHKEKKPDGSWQCCGDYRRLNNVTFLDTYPLPSMMDFSSGVAGCSIFTKIDLRKRYYQIPMHPADILKTTIITPFGLFEFLCLTFRLRNAGSTFQRLMDRVLAGLALTFVYLDDIIIPICTTVLLWLHSGQVLACLTRFTVTRLDMIFCYTDRVPLTHFVHRAKKVFGMWA